MTQTTPRTPVQGQETGGILLLSFELGKQKWVLTFGTLGKRTRRVELSAGDLKGLARQSGFARRKFGLPAGTPVLSCYEAGRDGFWLHRALLQMGVSNLVVDSSSIQVDRRARRAKNDRLDGAALLTLLRRHAGGEAGAWRVVNTPSEEAEDGRRLHRELERLKKEAAAHRNRIESLLALHGAALKPGADFAARLDELRLWNGLPLPPDLLAELKREHARLQFVQEQIRALKREQDERLKAAQAAGAPAPLALKKVLALKQLRGVDRAAWTLGMEFFGWREFRNGKQVGAAAGLTPTPYDSGGSSREQGISKAGNKRVRSLMVELGWCWLRYQPHSKITRWYQGKFGPGAKRARRVGIVAVARQVLVALWRYVDQGVVPEGAELKAA